MFDFIRSRGLMPARAVEMPSTTPPSRPARALRAAGRAIRSAMQFNAAGFDRLNASWTGTALPADWIITRNYRPLVARSREQAMNNDYARAFLRMCSQNIVGPKGITMKAAFQKADGSHDADTSRALKAAWEQWGHKSTADVAGKKSWRAIQRLLVKSAVQDGEFFLRIVTGKDAGKWGFAVQVIDPLRVPVDYNVDRYNQSNFIRHGIEFTRFGRPVAYHLSTVDDGEAEYEYAGVGYTTVPADQMVHGFLEDLVGQKRGLPWMATALFRMRNMGAFEDAAIINARVGASKMGFVQWKEGQAPEFEDGDDPTSLEFDAEPGSFNVLPEGAEMKEWLPQYPSGEFLPVFKTLLRGASAGFGVSYNNLASDLEGVNFSSIRQGTLDEREHWKELQEWLIEDAIQPVQEAWLRYSLLKGRIKVKGKPLSPALLDELQGAISWQPRRWQWIDPTADVNAAVESKNNLLTSAGRIIREWGGDPDEVFADIAADIKAMEAAGIDEKYILASMGQALAPPPVASEGSHPNS
jgi:lambda family phage portal protein